MRGAIVIGLAIAVAACGGGASDENALPDVEIVELTTEVNQSLSDIEGPAVINLWATWCAPCRAEIPDFEEVHQQRSDEVRFVGINVGENGDVAVEFVEEVGATYEQFLDPIGEVSTALNATSMPVTVVTNADGEIVVRHLGPLDQNGLNEAIDEALAG